MRTFRRSLFLVPIFLNLSCAIVLRVPSSTSLSPVLSFASVSSVPSYTCTPITISGQLASGQSWVASENMTLNLSGLGSGSAFSNLSDCKSGTNNTSTVFISAGSSNAVFYFRTSVAETINLTVSGPKIDTFQTSFTTSLFQVVGQPGTSRNVHLEKGLNTGAGGFFDGTHYFIVDKNNNRVLIYNSVPTAAGQSPDLVLGQPNLYSNTSNNGGVSASTLNSPSGLYSNGTRVFVSDTSNHRILIWNTFPTSNGQAADLVLGQSSFTGVGSNANVSVSASTLYSPNGLHYDGSKFYVADTTNNRVLVWNSLPTATFQAADFALGQPDMVTNSSNTGGLSASRMNQPIGVFGDGTRLFVADSSNHRVLIWNAVPAASGAAANLVLGQPNFISNTANNGGVSGSSMNNPQTIYTNGTKLFVVDQFNSRVLVWNSLPISNGQTADFALGQPNLTSSTLNNGGLSGSTMSFPAVISSDGTRITVGDYNNNRILFWNTLPTSFAEASSFVIGQPDSVTAKSNFSGTSGVSLYNPRGIYSDGTRLFVADQGNNRVLIWNSIPTSETQPADLVLGQNSLSEFAANSGGISASSLYSPQCVYTVGNKLFVCDVVNNRILVWNSIPSTNKQPADFVLGQPDFVSSTSNNGGISGSTFSAPESIASDGTRLVVADASNNRVLVWNTMPTSTAQAASFALGQAGFGTSTGNLGGISASSLFAPNGVFILGTQLYVADSLNNRVLVWNNLPTAFNQTADFALGQPGLTSNTSNNGGRSASTMSFPMGVFSDGIRLFVADTLNNRMLIWNSFPTSNGQAASSQVGQANFTVAVQNSGGLSATSLNSPRNSYSDGMRLFITDISNHRVLISPIP